MKILMLKTSPYNEEFIFLYGTTLKDLSEIAISYLLDVGLINHRMDVRDVSESKDGSERVITVLYAFGDDEHRTEFWVVEIEKI